MDNLIEIEDLKDIFKRNTSKKIFKNKKILITGCGGFIGYYLSKYFIHYLKALKIKKLYITSLNTKKFKNYQNSKIKVINFDIAKDNLKKFKSEFDIIIHAASIASPTFYRAKPIETMDANVTGLRKILDFYKNKKKKVKILYFSSSEIYGDAHSNFIPTKETYFGNVNPVGPRACYDESKRFCETLCYEYSKKFKNIAISVVRPFNNFGPGMSVYDARIPADLAKNILKRKNFIIYSDGSPKRTFCYISDAIVGYLNSLKVKKFEVLNIGSVEEITIKRFAELYQGASMKIFNFKPKIIFKKHKDSNYLKDNPNRRCPDLTKAKKIIKYKPKINTYLGIIKYLKFLKYEN